MYTLCGTFLLIWYEIVYFAGSLWKKTLCYSGCTLLTICSVLFKEPGITILVCCTLMISCCRYWSSVMLYFFCMLFDTNSELLIIVIRVIIVANYSLMWISKHDNRPECCLFQGVCLAYDWLVVARVNPYVLLQQPHSSAKNHRKVFMYFCGAFRYNSVTAVTVFFQWIVIDIGTAYT